MSPSQDGDGEPGGVLVGSDAFVALQPLQPYTLDSVVMSRYFQCLEFVESWWPFVGMSVVDRETGEIGKIKSRSEEGEWNIAFNRTQDTQLLPAYKFAPHSLAELRKHPDAPPKFVALANENAERIAVRKLDVNGCRRNIGY